MVGKVQRHRAQLRGYGNSLSVEGLDKDKSSVNAGRGKFERSFDKMRGEGERRILGVFHGH